MFLEGMKMFLSFPTMHNQLYTYCGNHGLLNFGILSYLVLLVPYQRYNIWHVGEQVLYTLNHLIYLLLHKQ